MDYDVGEVFFYNVIERCYIFIFFYVIFCGFVWLYFSLSYLGGKSVVFLIICFMSGIDGFFGYVGNYGYFMEIFF